MNYIEYNESDIQSFEYETTINSDGNVIGTCELGKATIQMLNNSNEYSSLKGYWLKTVHGSFYIYDVTPVQERINVKLECYDIKYRLDKPYDRLKHTFPCTLKEWRNSIFDDCEVKYDDSNFPSGDLVLNEEPYIGDNPSNRNVICQIAQAGMSFVVTDEQDKFYFKWFEETTHLVDDWSSLTTEKECTQSINVMILGRGDVEDNVHFPEVLPKTPVQFRIDNNYILDPQKTDSEYDQRYDVIQSLYERVNGFSYLIFNITTQNIANKLSVKIGQKIKYSDIWDNELEAYVMSKKIVYLGGDLSNDDNYQIILSANEIKETSTELKYSSSIKNDVLEVKRLADKMNGKIEDTVKKIDDSTEKMSQLKLDVDSISENVSKFTSQSETISKIELDVESIKQSIGSITDTTMTGSGTGTLSLQHILNSELLYVQIYPTKSDLTYLYSNNDLYPSDDLFLNSRDLIFANEENTYRFTLPCDLLYLSDTIKDEFILNYDTQEMYTIHRVGLDADGNKYALSQAQTQYFVYQPFVIEKDGDYTVKMQSFDDAYIYIRALAQNIYTAQYATKVELNNAITTTEQSINQSVNAKITQIDGNIVDLNASLELKLNTQDLLSEIALKSNLLTIDADNFKLTKNGHLTCNDATLNGIFEQYSKNGRLAIQIKNDDIAFYDTTSSMNNKTGGIMRDTMFNSGISLFAENGYSISFFTKDFISIDNESIEILDPILLAQKDQITCYKNLRILTAGNGAEVYDGTVTIGDKTITIANGLITNVY